ncbi:hypothetical protein D2A34_14320 [Clostridium chromiireducens]|uniref:Uncharacterized protein n=1 Tax=Clostridium chromiireducens TaxID=225345 RepID=A0A399IMI3_9CLOT|nr:hypothetical protein [Clostridium chromiireducens]RII34318.1 hypothetical protein D2A34_14320 [Clostridium chromiireducens]
MINLSKLENCFKVAKETNQKFIGVLIQMKGFKKSELIINERENFDNKLVYYKRAYNEDLTLKTFNEIKIIGYAFGENIQDIYEYLKNNDN